MGFNIENMKTYLEQIIHEVKARTWIGYTLRAYIAARIDGEVSISGFIMAGAYLGNRRMKSKI